MEKMFAKIQGVNVEVMVVDGVELPMAAIEGYEGTIQVHDVNFDGNMTYDFYVKDPACGLDTHVTYVFNPRATTY